MNTTLSSAVPQRSHTVELDVRDDLKNGREPFSRIMSTVDALPSDGILHLRATFEPVPLFRVLGKKGFMHEARENGEQDWSVWFWKEAKDSAVPDEAPERATTAADLESLPDTVVIDVRNMEPPEPMIMTLTALEKLPDGYCLIQLNQRVPQFLLPVLTERGYGYEIDENHPAGVVVQIRKLA